MDSRIHVFVLQHPQEPDRDLGSARIANLALSNSTLKVGLSWPNLKKALGREDADPARWAVLYLGSGVKGGAKPQTAGQSLRATPCEAAPSGTAPGPAPTRKPGPQGTELTITDKKGTPLPDQKKAIAELEGIVLLDGTWSQAKALWWRNPWLLKLKRIILNPREKSLYKELRWEPRSECLSTIESIAVALTSLGEPTQTGERLRALFAELLDRYRKSGLSRRPSSGQRTGNPRTGGPGAGRPDRRRFRRRK